MSDRRDPPNRPLGAMAAMAQRAADPERLHAGKAESTATPRAVAVQGLST